MTISAAGAGRHPAPPSGGQLRAGATRSAIAVVLLAGAALVGHVSDLAGQVLPYVAMAGAVVPQLLLCLLALFDDRRREALVVSRRPLPVVVIVGLVLAGSAVVDAVRHGLSSLPMWAAVLAAIGCAVCGVPPVVSARRRRPRPH